MSLILVVDDERSILEVLTDVLEGEGHRVVTACNGHEGMECLRRMRPDLVLLDWMMPQVDGRQMLAAMREHSAWAEVPVLVMSAGRLSPAERSHIPYFLAKPFELDALLELIARLLAR
ncbi:MAG: response regulator [Myxococcaceae bacterium]|nr:response regulator [Myxococcaceae bacterium]